jgi:hypothetical protein
MKEKLIEMLDLKPAQGEAEVSEQQIISAVAFNQSQLYGHHHGVKYEKAIKAVFVESAGTLSREGAIEVLAQRAAAATKAQMK